MRVGVTGHRPNKLWGYNIYTKPYIALRYKFRRLLIDYKCTHAKSGMALGADTVFALAVLDLKKQGFDIELECCVPCKNHSSKWVNPLDIALYSKILELADIVTIVSDVNYQPWVMQVRNEYIVDNIDKLIGLWDGTPGGTKNCIDYAKSIGRDILIIEPKEIEVGING